MTVSNIHIRRLAGQSLQVTWEADTEGPFRVYRDGIGVVETKLKQAKLYAGLGEFPHVEVIDDGSAPTPVNAARLVLRFDGVANAKSYRIERFDGMWTIEHRMLHDARTGPYVYRTEPVEAGVTAQYRIIPEGTNGEDGTAVVLDKSVIRHPDPPAYSHALNGNGTLTLTETGV